MRLCTSKCNYNVALSALTILFHHFDLFYVGINLVILNMFQDHRINVDGVKRLVHLPLKYILSSLHKQPKTMLPLKMEIQSPVGAQNPHLVNETPSQYRNFKSRFSSHFFGSNFKQSFICTSSDLEWSGLKPNAIL